MDAGVGSGFMYILTGLGCMGENHLGADSAFSGAICVTGHAHIRLRCLGVQGGMACIIQRQMHRMYQEAGKPLSLLLWPRLGQLASPARAMLQAQALPPAGRLWGCGHPPGGARRGQEGRQCPLSSLRGENHTVRPAAAVQAALSDLPARKSA